MARKYFFTQLFLLSFILCSCTLSAQESQDIDAVQEEIEIMAVGEAFIEGTSEDSNLYGLAIFTETADGLVVEASLFDTPPGKHGFHIHEFGSCNDSGNAAGGHYNPEGVKHGHFEKDGVYAAHIGDLGNIEVNKEGEGSLTAFLPGVSLTDGITNVAGRAVIVHEKADDFGQPTGNAGGRIGCGPVVLTKE